MHNRTRLAIAAIAALGMLAMPATALASPSMNVSFSASQDGASAHWSNGKGSPIDLTVGSSAGSYAVVTLHHFDPDPNAADPSFATSNYAAGSPRFVISFNNDQYLFGYPNNTWEIAGQSGYYSSYADALAGMRRPSDRGPLEITSVYVVADADQAPGTVDVITALQFDGQQLVG